MRALSATTIMTGLERASPIGLKSSALYRELECHLERQPFASQSDLGAPHMILKSFICGAVVCGWTGLYYTLTADRKDQTGCTTCNWDTFVFCSIQI